MQVQILPSPLSLNSKGVDVIYTVLDFETTGFDYNKDQIIEIGALKLDPGCNVVGQFSTKVALRDGMVLSDDIIDLTGLTPKTLSYGLNEQNAKDALNSFIADDIIIAQFASFDLGFLQSSNDFICTKALYQMLNPGLKSGLKDIVKDYGIQYKAHHQAMADSLMTAKAFKIMKYEADQYDMEYLNVMIDTAERPLPYVPAKAKVIKL